jgi:hypothetical protein
VSVGVVDGGCAWNLEAEGVMIAVDGRSVRPGVGARQR